MNKKKYLILLSILLLSLFVGSFSSCYATSFSDAELKNIFYNSLTNFGQHDTQEVKSALDSFDFSQWNLTSEYSYTTIYCNIQENGLSNNSSYLMYIYYNNDATKKSQLGYNYCKAYYYIQYRNGVVTKYFGGVLNSSTFIQQNGHAYNYMVRYNDLDLYNGAGNTVVVSAGWHPSNIDEGIYNDIIWKFDYPSGFDYTIKNTTNWTYRGITQGYQINVGSITDSQYVDNIQYRFGSWNGSQYVWSNYKTLYSYSRNGNIKNYFSGSTVNNNGVLTTTLYLDTFNNGNNILEIKVSPDNTDLTKLYNYYYVLNNNTSVTGTVIDPGYTFSGDYKQEYNQQEQTNNITSSVEDSTDKVIETITDDSQVNNILNENLSGDAIINNIGYSFVTNPFENIIKNTLQAFTDALLGTGNQTLSFQVMNTNIQLKSQDFSLPNGELKNFIALISNAVVVYLICKYGFKLYQWINTGRIQNLVNEQNNKQYYLF